MRTFMTFIARFSRQTGGNVAMIFGLSAIVIIGSGGAAVDLVSAASVRADIQDALDSAVLTGIRSDTAERTPAATKAFNANISSSLSGKISQSYATQGDNFNGIATYNTPTMMMGLIGIDSLSLKVASTATGTPAKGKAGPCVYILDPSGSQALLVNSGANISAPNCEIHVKSTAQPAAMFNSGSNLNFKKLCIQGAKVTQNSTTVANLQTSCAAESDPYAGNMPAVNSNTCNYSNLNYNGGTVNLTPGVYCGWVNFNSGTNVNLAPGLYIIKNGGWNVNGGTWTGNGVTFYFADTSKIQFNSGMNTSLSAPTSGTYKGILVFEAPNLSKSQFIFNNANGNNMDGLIWLPSREMTFNAKSLMQSDSMTMVVHRLILNNTDWNLTPDTSNTTTVTSGGLTNIRLIK